MAANETFKREKATLHARSSVWTRWRAPSNAETDSERGSVLILALVYIISISLIVGALADWAMNDLNNTNHFQSESSLEYAATSATQVAISSIRYNPLYSVTASNNPPGLGYCWTPSGAANLSQLTNFDGFNVTVWCSTAENLASANTRVVSFYACTSPTTVPATLAAADADGATCAAKPLLYAQVAYDDYLPGATTLAATCAGPSYCGYGATELQWSWSGAAESVGEALNTITVTSIAPASATDGGATYNAVASATSGDSVVVTSASTGVCTVAGTVVSMVGVGNCTLDFNDNGNLNFAPAPQVTQSFTVSS
jgi:hypothetical protein